MALRKGTVNRLPDGSIVINPTSFPGVNSAAFSNQSNPPTVEPGMWFVGLDPQDLTYKPNMVQQAVDEGIIPQEQLAEYGQTAMGFRIPIDMTPDSGSEVGSNADFGVVQDTNPNPNPNPNPNANPNVGGFNRFGNRDDDDRTGGAGRGARDTARLLAQQYGLGDDLFSEVEKLLFEDASEASIIIALRSTDAYKKRFAANASRVAKGLPALSEAEYIRMESLYRQELRSAGLPSEFYDDLNDFKTYIENDLSYNEFVSRVGLARRASQMANPEVKMQLKNLYGVGDEQLVGYFLNPQKATTMLQKQFNVAQTAGALSRAGFGTTMAEELTSTVTAGSPESLLNFTELEAAAQTAATARPLSMQVLGGEGGAVSEQDLLRGIVAEDVQSQRRLQREQQRRLAEYQAGGSMIEGQQGVLGLRSAAR